MEFSQNLKVIYQIYKNVGELKLYFTGVSGYAPIMKTFIGKLKFEVIVKTQ